METPSANGSNGRDAQGRFLPGNPGGPGNPFARRCAAMRTAFLEAISADDMQEIVRVLVEKAKAGDLVATKLILLWAVGRPEDPHHPDAVARMVAAAEEAECRPNVGQYSLPMPADREARLDQVARALAHDMRRVRQAGPAPGDAVEKAIENLNGFPDLSSI